MQVRKLQRILAKYEEPLSRCKDQDYFTNCKTDSLACQKLQEHEEKSEGIGKLLSQKTITKVII